MDYITFYNMLQESLCEPDSTSEHTQHIQAEEQAAADSAAASSAALAPLALPPEATRTEEGLVASSGAAASIQHNQLRQPGALAAAGQLARTIKAAQLGVQIVPTSGFSSRTRCRSMPNKERVGHRAAVTFTADCWVCLRCQWQCGGSAGLWINMGTELASKLNRKSRAWPTGLEETFNRHLC